MHIFCLQNKIPKKTQRKTQRRNNCKNTFNTKKTVLQQSFEYYFFKRLLLKVTKNVKRKPIYGHQISLKIASRNQVRLGGKKSESAKKKQYQAKQELSQKLTDSMMA